VLVEKLRSPSPLLRLARPVDQLVNTFELVVHHEDLRRAQPDWAPRSLPAADVDVLWSQLGRVGAFFGRRLPVPVVVRRADTGATRVVREGADPVTVSGDVVELVLFLFGRSAVREVSFDGPQDRVLTLRSADLGV
jgi:uncharacterized protein (TIGR03085 family)